MSYFIGIDLKNYKDKLDSVELNTDLNKVSTHHITVFSLGKLNDKRSERITGRLQTFDYKKFSLNVDRLCSFSEDGEDKFLALSFENRKPLFNLLFSLIEYLEEMPTWGTGLQHITLYRSKQSAGLPDMERRVTGKIKEPFNIEVDNLVLYKSRSTETGILNDYEEILTIPLV